MTKKLFLLPLLLLLTLLAGCTQNNGDISPWFGYWRMTSLTVNGEPDPAYDGLISWSFQSRIVSINSYTPAHDYSESYGTWEAHGSILTIDYTHWRDQGDMSYLYMPPAVLRLPLDSPADFDILSCSGREITLRRSLSDGSIMTCVLEKVY